MFKFGGGKVLTSIASLELPGVLADRKVTIKTDVVTSDIPLLLSLETMKKAGVKLDLVNDSAEIFGKHSQALHESHKAFIQSEADERITRALQYKIRASKQLFNPNDLFGIYSQLSHHIQTKLHLKISR